MFNIFKKCYGCGDRDFWYGESYNIDNKKVYFCFNCYIQYVPERIINNKKQLCPHKWFTNAYGFKICTLCRDIEDLTPPPERTEVE